MPRRTEQVAALLKHEAAAFFNTISPANCLVTVTNIKLSSDYQYATVYISVFPDSRVDDVIALAQKNIYELKEHIKDNTELGRIPWLKVEFDEGEKHRQRIDEVSRNL